jgi:hypothetical protein
MPDNKLKMVWDALIVYHLLYVATYVPYKTCFIDDTSDAAFVYELWMDACFLTDIVLTFFTAKAKGSKLITDKKKIAKSYL